MYPPGLIKRRYRVKPEEGFDNLLVIDQVPIVDKTRLDRLLSKMSKDFGKKGVPVKPEDMFVPWDDATDKNKGCVRIIFMSVLDNAVIELGWKQIRLCRVP